MSNVDKLSNLEHVNNIYVLYNLHVKLKLYRGLYNIISYLVGYEFSKLNHSLHFLILNKQELMKQKKIYFHWFDV